MLKDGMAGGASFGKRQFGLMVVNVKTNTPCTMRESFLRQAGSSALFFQIIDPFIAGMTSKGLTVGDVAAGTQVILAKDFRM